MYTNENYKYSDLTSRVIGCAMKVHSVLGTGFQEVIYQRALAIELEKADVPFARELEMSIYYDDIEIGQRRVDFLIANKVMVELKAISLLEDLHYAQIINYLEVYKLEIGLLINCGAKKLEFRRFTNERKLNGLISRPK